jgi:hypothetical protein
MLSERAGCVPRTRRATLVLTSPITGYTFDSRVASGTALTLAGKRVPLQLAHFPKLEVTFFFRRGRLPLLFKEVTLRDAAGRVVARQVLKR